jgi:sulfite exporter TauE/SafE/copper chaperone CopZ/plastocyanin
MHCAACEVLIEKKIRKIKGVTAADASLKRGTVTITSDKTPPSAKSLDQALASDGYTFARQSQANGGTQPLVAWRRGNLVINPAKARQLGRSLLLVTILVVGFYLFERTGLTGAVSVNASSSLVTFFAFGVLAGLSSCAALVGGLLLSVSGNWTKLYAGDRAHAAEPFVLFNAGRVVSYALLGGLLGALGGVLGINSVGGSPVGTALVIAAVSVMMFVLGLQMLGVGWAARFQVRLPRALTRHATESDRHDGRRAPFVVGALTFFLPCGFTVVAQGLALSSGSFLTGGLIMLAFALGTLPMLAVVSLSSLRLGGSQRFGRGFQQVAGTLVLFFALYNLNAQLNVLGMPSLSDIRFGGGGSSEAAAAAVTDMGDYQLVRMTANARGYAPRTLTVAAGKPIRWEINDTGTSGCTNAIISRELLGSETVPLQRGLNVVEIDALEAGTYKYSCWMGMVDGVIQAI